MDYGAQEVFHCCFTDRAGKADTQYTWSLSTGVCWRIYTSFHLVDKLWWGASQSQRIPTKHPFSDFILLLCHNLFQSQCMRDSQKTHVWDRNQEKRNCRKHQSSCRPLDQPWSQFSFDNFSRGFFVYKPIRDVGFASKCAKQWQYCWNSVALINCVISWEALWNSIENSTLN